MSIDQFCATLGIFRPTFYRYLSLSNAEEIQMPRVWQVNANQPHPWPCDSNCGMCKGTRYAATGRQWQGHYYGNLFLQYGVALISPINCPPATLQQFRVQVAIDDIILLRPGTVSSICAAGLIASAHMAPNQFDDVYGWQLDQARRVRWKLCQHDFGRQVFFPVRFSSVRNAGVVECAQQCIQMPPYDWRTDPLPPLPPGPLNLPPIPYNP